MGEYGYSVRVDEGYDEAVIRARLALRREGFSILTEMHVGGVLGPEAGSDRQYLIMAVWNAPVEQKEIATGLHAAVHLPCNVVVQEVERNAVVAALDPGEASEEGAEVSPQVAELARSALMRALHALDSPLP